MFVIVLFLLSHRTTKRYLNINIIPHAVKKFSKSSVYKRITDFDKKSQPSVYKRITDLVSCKQSQLCQADKTKLPTWMSAATFQGKSYLHTSLKTICLADKKNHQTYAGNFPNATFHKVRKPDSAVLRRYKFTNHQDIFAKTIWVPNKAARTTLSLLLWSLVTEWKQDELISVICIQMFRHSLLRTTKNV